MHLVTGSDTVCKEIAKALGIKHCRSLDLRIRHDEVVSVKVEFYPEVDGVMQIEKVLEDYELVKKEQTNAD